MAEELSLSFIFNNGVAIAVAWYVLTRLNVTLKDLTNAISKLGGDLNQRLNTLEVNQRELKLQIDSIKRGDA